jgi:dolichol kinase
VTTLAVETGDFAKELYDLLRTLDRPPGEEALLVLRARLDRMVERCRELTSDSARDEAVAALIRVLREILASLEELRERIVRGWSPQALSSFRAAAAPRYEALVARLRALRVEVPSLRPSNVKRNAYHVANALFAAGCVELLPSRSWLVAMSGAFLAFGATLEIGRRISPAWSRFSMKLFRSVAHPAEEFRVNSGTFYAIALFTLACLAGKIACLLAVLTLGIGDPTAALIGRRWGRTRLNAGRSLEGALAFAVSAGIACFLGLTLFHGNVSLSLRLALAAAAGITGAAAELLSVRVDDNLTIPLAVAGSAELLLWLAPK